VRASSNDQWRRAINVVFALSQALAPGLASLGLGQSIGSRSDAVATAITPAGWAFVIWAPLFASCLAYAFDQARPSRMMNALYRRVGWLTAAAFLANTLWQVDVILRGLKPLSVFLIFALLGTVLLGHVRLASPATSLDRVHRWLAAPALGALAGWISAAALVNIASVLKGSGHGAMTAVPSANVTIAIAVIALGTGLAAIIQTRHGASPWFAAAFAWALVGIVGANLQDATGVALAAGCGAAVVAILTAVRLIEPQRRQRWLGALS